MSADEMGAYTNSLRQKAASDPAAWGKYLVSFLGCSDCHSPVNPDGSLMHGYELAGGQRWNLEPYFTQLYTANLTSDKETGLGRYTDEQIRNAITKGIRLEDGSRMLPFPMPWPNYAGLTSGDVDAVIAYLRTVPPVSNDVPQREEPNMLSYLWMKFEMLVLKKPFPAFIFGGNAGNQKEQSISENVSSGRGVRP
jgi:hypothetical protein